MNPKFKAACLCLVAAVSISREYSLLGIPDNSYLNYARIQLDTLLEHGMDVHGEVKSNLWASVMDIEELVVPEGGIKPTEGVWEYDRALGGSNLYHELDTIKSLDLLSVLSGGSNYARAADKYIVDSFKLTQNPDSGLLGWGEHLYNNFYLDKIWVGPIEPERKRDHYYKEMPHELMEFTPAWDRFHSLNPGGVSRAIDGLIYHFNGPEPKTYLFNRHAFWHPLERQHVLPSHWRGRL